MGTLELHQNLHGHSRNISMITYLVLDMGSNHMIPKLVFEEPFNIRLIGRNGLTR